MRKIFFAICCQFMAFSSFGQFHVKGVLTDSSGQPVAYATIAFLSPQDSTLQYYGISDAGGLFLVKGVRADTFLLQVGALEYKTWYRKAFFDKEADLGKITLKNKSHLLNEVETVSEKLPLLLKGDTIEYDAGAYKIRPDAVAEDLLKKLPGLEVDRAGNIKAQGEQVSKVLVDGKEFFSNDPKVATKNLPADAVKKVQVYDGKSEQSQFSGIDDGTRDKTINLELKDNKRKGYFGSLMAGGGTNERYQLNGKLYRFRKKSQLALLGMSNNINEFGFTLDDYLSFQGGLRGLMDGNGNAQFRMNSADNLPVNFGQSVKGLINSAAGGINYTYEPENNKKFNISYMGNASGKQLDETNSSINFTPSGSFERREAVSEWTENQAHRVSMGVRNDLDSSTQITFNSGASLSKTAMNRSLLSSSFVVQAVLNNLNSIIVDDGFSIAANGRLSFQKKWRTKFPLFKLSAQFSYNGTLTNTDWENLTSYPGKPDIMDVQFQDDKLESLVYSLSSSIVRSLGNGFYVEPVLTVANDIDKIDRSQGQGVGQSDQSIDSLSPSFIRKGQYLRPGVSLQNTKDKRRLRLGVGYEMGRIVSHLNSIEIHSLSYAYVMPSIDWRKELSRGKVLEFSYNTDVQFPMARQMLPVANATNPLQEYRGNPQLRPEYQHQLGIHCIRFDEFNLSSFFANIFLRYTYDKINWSRHTAADLSQEVTMVNVQDDYQASGRVEYSTPIRKLGITVSGSIGERYQQGLNLVNDVKNATTLFEHNAEMKLGNRKKDKWDIQVGASITYTDAKYSIHTELNSYFYNVAYFGELSYKPNSHLYFACIADVNSYYSKSFNGTVNIPLLKAEASWFFLKNNRGSLTFNAFDLLNSNRGLERISELSYLSEKRYNIISQYFMLSFKYRLNKSEGKSGGNVISIGR